MYIINTCITSEHGKYSWHCCIDTNGFDYKLNNVKQR